VAEVVLGGLVLLGLAHGGQLLADRAAVGKRVPGKVLHMWKGTLYCIGPLLLRDVVISHRCVESYTVQTVLLFEKNAF
jgi:hypothetical protein